MLGWHAAGLYLFENKVHNSTCVHMLAPDCVCSHQLSGTIPLSIGNLSSIQQLDWYATIAFCTPVHTVLSMNGMSGAPLPRSSNRLSGPIPDTACGLTKLQALLDHL